jgi:Hemerythrin HHE cation binding domain
VTYTELGRAIGHHLIEVHDHFRGELAQLLDLVEQLRGGLIDGGEARSFVASMTIRQNSWTVGAYCASYCRMLTEHHGMEDSAIFPHLRSSEPGLSPVLDRLAEEHLVIHGVLESVDAAFVAYLLDPTDFTEVDQAADALSKTLLSHLAYEEAQLVAPLARRGFYRGQV